MSVVETKGSNPPSQMQKITVKEVMKLYGDGFVKSKFEIGTHLNTLFDLDYTDTEYSISKFNEFLNQLPFGDVVANKFMKIAKCGYLKDLAMNDEVVANLPSSYNTLYAFTNSKIIKSNSLKKHISESFMNGTFEYYSLNFNEKKSEENDGNKIVVQSNKIKPSELKDFIAYVTYLNDSTEDFKVAVQEDGFNIIDFMKSDEEKLNEQTEEEILNQYNNIDKGSGEGSTANNETSDDYVTVLELQVNPQSFVDDYQKSEELFNFITEKFKISNHKLKGDIKVKKIVEPLTKIKTDAKETEKTNLFNQKFSPNALNEAA